MTDLPLDKPRRLAYIENVSNGEHHVAQVQ